MISHKVKSGKLGISVNYLKNGVLVQSENEEDQQCYQSRVVLSATDAITCAGGLLEYGGLLLNDQTQGTMYEVKFGKVFISSSPVENAIILTLRENDEQCAVMLSYVEAILYAGVLLQKSSIVLSASSQCQEHSVEIESLEEHRYKEIEDSVTDDLVEYYRRCVDRGEI